MRAILCAALTAFVRTCALRDRLGRRRSRRLAARELGFQLALGHRTGAHVPREPEAGCGRSIGGSHRSPYRSCQPPSAHGGPRAARRGRADPRVFALFDLDGFKSYNDSFGHPAGDSLLVELAERLQTAVAPDGCAYRLGGDEFCIVAPRTHPASEPIATASAALSAHGEGFTIGSSSGVVFLPQEAADAGAALRITDRRMYAAKSRRPRSAERQMRNCSSACCVSGSRSLTGTSERRPARDRARTDDPSRRRAARRGSARRGAPRHRQDRRARRDPAQARTAELRRMGDHAQSPGDRRAHPLVRACHDARREVGPLDPRMMGRRRVPGRARRRGDPTRFAPDRGL